MSPIDVGGFVSYQSPTRRKVYLYNIHACLVPLFIPLFTSSTQPPSWTRTSERERVRKGLNIGGVGEWRSMVLHCDWSSSIWVLPVTPPPSCALYQPFQWEKTAKSPQLSISSYSSASGELDLCALTGKLRCELTPPEDGNLEHRYRNISSRVGNSGQGEEEKVAWQVGGQSCLVISCALVCSLVGPTVIFLVVAQSNVNSVHVSVLCVSLLLKYENAVMHVWALWLITFDYAKLVIWLRFQWQSVA